MITALLARSQHCHQSLRYDCRQSRLHGSDGSMYGWWVSWHGDTVQHWSGSGPLQPGQCQCGLTGSCVRPDLGCNCDAAQDQWSHDTGVITDMELLPVSQLHFGDTGTPFDDKEGRFTLGPLSCVLTPPPELHHSVHLAPAHGHATQCPDVYFEFQWSSGAVREGVVYEMLTSDTLCRVTVTRDGVMYQWRHQGMVTTDNVTLALDIGHTWHSVNVEHNSVEISLIVEREHMASLTNKNPVSNNRRTRFYSKVIKCIQK